MTKMNSERKPSVMTKRTVVRTLSTTGVMEATRAGEGLSIPAVTFNYKIHLCKTVMVDDVMSGLELVLDAIPNSVPDHTFICMYPVSKGAHLTLYTSRLEATRPLKLTISYRATLFPL